MTTKIVDKAELADGYASLEMLPDPPRVPDMQQHKHITRTDQILEIYFRHRSDVLVNGAGYLCWDTPGDSWLVPDCVVAFGVNPDDFESRNGYVINDAGKPPEFVLEIASKSTGRADYTYKRDGYAEFGVSEYWRFDPTGGEYHDQPLAGDMLVDGEYQSVELEYRPGGTIWGYSPVLGLYLCWDNKRLRFWDPATRRFLPTPAETADALEAAEAKLQQLLERFRRQRSE